MNLFYSVVYRLLIYTACCTVITSISLTLGVGNTLVYCANRTSWLKLPLRSFKRSNFTCYLIMVSVKLLRMKFNTFYILLTRKVNKGLTQGEYKHVAFVQLYTCFTLNDICFVLNLTSQQTIKINEIVISSDW